MFLWRCVWRTLCYLPFFAWFQDKSSKMFKIIAFRNKWFSACVWHKIEKSHETCTMRLHFHWRFVWKHAVCLFEYVYMVETRQFYCLVLHTLCEYHKCFERSFFTHLVSLFSSSFSSIILAVFSSFFSIFSFFVCLSNQNELNTFEM